MAELKPFQVIVMAVFGVVALVGLFLFANFKGFNSGVVPVGPVTIWGTLPERAMQNQITTLRDSHAELAKVNYYEKSLETFDAELSDAIASGRGPDLILISQEQLAGEEDKIVLITSAATSERTFRDTYLPQAELLLYDKGAYGIPFVLDPLMLYYNRAHLTSVGSANPPQTWEAVAGLSPALTRYDQAGGIVKSGVAFGTYENIENARAIISLLFMQAGYTITDRTTDGIRATITRTRTEGTGISPAVSALSYYMQFANPAKTSYSWNRTLKSDRQAFLAGDLTLYPGFASEEPIITAGNPNLDFDMAPMPRAATLESKSTYGRLYAFSIPKASKNATGAERVAGILTARDVLPTFAHALHMAPAQRSMLVPTPGDLFEPVYFPEALRAKGWLSPSPEKTDGLLGTMVSSVTTGREDPSSAISTFDQAVSATLR